MKKLILLCVLFIAFEVSAQVVMTPKGYEFTVKENVACTPVKAQGRTGTCWSFSTVSFLESELLRMGKKDHDLSEMFIVRNIYKDKALNYVLRQGKAQFSQGSLNHDAIRILQKYGAMPESAYSGKVNDETSHDHSEMFKGLKGYLDGILGSKRLSPKWQAGFEGILDAYLGEEPKDQNAKAYAKGLGINAEDYVEITSYTHHPFYEQFILEIPDNYSNGSYYNVPLEDLLAITNNALKKGYSIAWDGDVSEKTFDARKGLAILPIDENREDALDKPSKEQKVTQADRQSTFLSYSTTDDHLMHLVGSAEDQLGNNYYLIKNSWGEISDYKGFLYMSEAYFKLKTVGLLLHKDAIPSDIRKKLGL